MLNFLNKKLFLILVCFVLPAKAMQEIKTSEEARESSANSKIIAFNKYKKINDTFPDTVKFLSKILSKMGIEDLSLQLAIIIYLKEYLFELKGYCSTQKSFSKFICGHQVVLMTKKQVIAHMNDLRTIDSREVYFMPTPELAVPVRLDNLITSILASIETKTIYRSGFDEGVPATNFKRVMIRNAHNDEVSIKLIPSKITPTNKFILDINKPDSFVFEEDFHSTFEDSVLSEWMPCIVTVCCIMAYIFIGWYCYKDLPDIENIEEVKKYYMQLMANRRIMC